jgi:hypothetical protein
MNDDTVIPTDWQRVSFLKETSRRFLEIDEII